MSQIKTKIVNPRSPSKKCQVCRSDLNDAEKDFYPCPCSFQVCLYCFKDIKDGKAACPQCHSLYRPERMHQQKKDDLLKKDAERNKRKKPEAKHSASSDNGNSSSRTADDDDNSVSKWYREGTDLSKIRVIQKTLVYIIGLAPEIASEKTLEKPEYLSQYGTITKIVVNKNHAYNPAGLNGPSYSAYVTYSTEDEASTAILAIDQFGIHDRIIRASYGTTKYCSFFLKDQSCPNFDCLYLHAIGKEKETFMKDDMLNNKNMFQDQQRIAAHQLKKNQFEIVKAANRKKIKSVFPSPTIITQKIKVVEADDLEKAQNNSATRRKNDADLDESRHGRKDYEKYVLKGHQKVYYNPYKDGSKTDCEKSEDGCDLSDKNQERTSLNSTATTISLGLPTWEDNDRIIIRKRDRESIALDNNTANTTAENSESGCFKHIDSENDTHSDKHLTDEDPKKDFEVDFPPLNEQSSQEDAKASLKISHDDPELIRSPSRTSNDEQTKASINETPSSPTKSDEEEELTSEDLTYLDKRISDRISSSANLNASSRFKFAQEAPEREEFDEIFRSIERYIGCGLTRNQKSCPPGSTSPDSLSSEKLVILPYSSDHTPSHLMLTDEMSANNEVSPFLTFEEYLENEIIESQMTENERNKEEIELMYVKFQKALAAAATRRFDPKSSHFYPSQAVAEAALKNAPSEASLKKSPSSSSIPATGSELPWATKLPTKKKLTLPQNINIAKNAPPFYSITTQSKKATATNNSSSVTITHTTINNNTNDIKAGQKTGVLRHNNKEFNPIQSH